MLLEAFFRWGSAAGYRGFQPMKRAEHRFSAAGMVASRFCGQRTNDCPGRTETAMARAHVFMAAELRLRAQAAARRIA